MKQHDETILVTGSRGPISERFRVSGFHQTRPPEPPPTTESICVDLPSDRSVPLGTPRTIIGAFLGRWTCQFEKNVWAQVGLVMLIGLSAKNAILMIEFAKRELEQGRSLREATLNGVRLRLRPILITSLAFALGGVFLLVAAGAGAVARQILGTVVLTGMLAATLIGMFLVPVLFVATERLTQRQERSHTLARIVRAIAEGVVD